VNQIKALCATIFFVLIMLLAVQNVDVLSRAETLGLHWPHSLAFTWELPLYALILLIFLAGFGLVSLFSMREYLGRWNLLRDARKQIRTLEQELKPRSVEVQAPAEPLSPPAHAADRSQEPHQTETEDAMHSPPATPLAESSEPRPQPQTRISDDEILVRPSPPGWGAVLLLTAAMALVVSGGVYVVFNERLSQLTTQLDHVSGLTGHLSSAHQEMNRSWEQERVAVREEIDAMHRSNADLHKEIGSLGEQVQALSRLPEEVRKRLMAGFLRDTAGRAAFLGTQVENDEQREALRDIHERLQALALELEGGAAERAAEE